MRPIHAIEPTQELYWNKSDLVSSASNKLIEPTQELYWNYSAPLQSPVTIALNRHKSCIEIGVRQDRASHLESIEPTQELYWNDIMEQYPKQEDAIEPTQELYWNKEIYKFGDDNITIEPTQELYWNFFYSFLIWLQF